MLAAALLSSEEIERLASVPLFATATEAERREIAMHTRKRSYKRGEVIHHADDVAGDVFVITRGHVKHRLTAPDGRQLTHTVQGPGLCFGLMSVIDGKRRAGDAVAVTDCEVLVIGRDVIAALLARHPEASVLLLQQQVNSVRRMQALVHDVAFLNVPMRLAKALLAFAEGDPPVVPAHLNQTELAYIVVTSRESVNQWLKRFSRQGWIAFDRTGIRILNADSLRRTIG